MQQVSYTDFGFELRSHAAAKTKSGMVLDCQIVFGSPAIPADEIEAQRDLEALIMSGHIRTFGAIDHVQSWTFTFPKVTPEQPDACLITFHYQAIANPLREQERLDRVEAFLKPLGLLLPSNNL